MIKSTYKGLPYLVTRPRPHETPICTVALYIDLRGAARIIKDASPASLRQTLRSIWRSEDHLRSDIVFQQTSDDLLILFRSVLNDKVTLDTQLATVSRFLCADGLQRTDSAISADLDKYLTMQSQSDPTYTFQDLVDYHVYGMYRKHFLDLPPRVPLLGVALATEILNRSPVALICLNGNEQRCRYIIKRLWPNRQTLALDPMPCLSPPDRPAQSLMFNYHWPHCEETAYSATLWPSDPKENIDGWLSSILGGGFAFSSGGPGKGLFSRFHQKVLPISGVQSATGVSLGQKYTGFEISALDGAPYNVAYQRCWQILNDLVDNGPTDTELRRTKNKLLFEINEQDPLIIARAHAQSILPSFSRPLSDEERIDRVCRMTKHTCIRSLETMLSKPKIHIRLSP